MNLSNSIHSVIPSVHGDVLGVLGRTDRPLSGRGVAELVGGRASTMGVSLVLRALVAEGIVLAEEQPPAIMYRLNREHLAADGIILLANMRERLFELMRDLVNTWQRASYGVWIFGSFARGTATSQSDIDVLAVRSSEVHESDEVWRLQLREYSRKVSAWTGNDCRTIEFSQEDFMLLFEHDDRLVQELRNDGISLTRRRLPAIRPTKVSA